MSDINSKPVSCANLATALDITTTASPGTGDKPVSCALLKAMLESPLPPKPGKPLESYTWAELAQLGAQYAGTGELDYLIGQVKCVANSGFGAVGFRLIDLNHENLTAGGKAPMTFQSSMIVALWLIANTVSDIDWSESGLRRYLNGTFLNLIDDDVRPVIKQVHNATAANTMYTDDYVFLASETGIFGYSSASGNNESGESQYSYWAAHNTNDDRKLSYGYDRAADKIALFSTGWFTRSMVNSYGQYAIVSKNGSHSQDYPHSSDCGTVPCFCI